MKRALLAVAALMPLFACSVKVPTTSSIKAIVCNMYRPSSSSCSHSGMACALEDGSPGTCGWSQTAGGIACNDYLPPSSQLCTHSGMSCTRDDGTPGTCGWGR